jgi:BolA protein
MTTQREKLQVLTLQLPFFVMASRPWMPILAVDDVPLETYAASMSVKDDITKKLREAFAPDRLDVTDESHLHAGHAGHRPEGETHFRLYIVSPAFEGKSRIERHRMINAALTAELAGPVHALAIKAQTPAENI